MQLSSAIVLGDTLKRSTSTNWLQKRWGGWWGCAIGGALLAMGLGEQFLAEITHTGMSPLDCPSVEKALPWLTQPILDEITRLYHEVIQGRITIETVAAYVQTVEPQTISVEIGEYQFGFSGIKTYA